jgi:hypothetical protein
MTQRRQITFVTQQPTLTVTVRRNIDLPGLAWIHHPDAASASTPSSTNSA